eukprot:snap_masked-scaffold_19-processed-gene-3.12-mRNA-1 protein AED:0.08 eAED:0.08 QI:0/-1/0/1/-1/1/1/0/302
MVSEETTNPTPDIQEGCCEDCNKLNQNNDRESVNLDWLHLTDDENEDYEVWDHKISEEDLYYQNQDRISKANNDLLKEGVSPRYFDTTKIYPETSSLISKENFEKIKNEMQNFLNLQKEDENKNLWTPWPEDNLYNGPQQSGDWKIVPLLYTFPALDASRSKWVQKNVNLFPETTKILKNIPNLRTALFSRLGGTTRLSAHQGWADLSNHVLRNHLGLIIPENSNNLCGMWVEGHIQCHKEQKLLTFDDSKWHKAFNATDEDRIILLFDVLRPEDVPLGKAEAGHTDKLDGFIAQFEALSVE